MVARSTCKVSQTARAHNLRSPLKPTVVVVMAVMVVMGVVSQSHLSARTMLALTPRLRQAPVQVTVLLLAWVNNTATPGMRTETRTVTAVVPRATAPLGVLWKRSCGGRRQYCTAVATDYCYRMSRRCWHVFPAIHSQK